MDLDYLEDALREHRTARQVYLPDMIAEFYDMFVTSCTSQSSKFRECPHILVLWQLCVCVRVCVR